MRNLEKRIRSLEELVFDVILEAKAETMAIRDILIEKNLVSSDQWDELVHHHKTSYDSFKVITEVERRHNSTSPSVPRDKELNGQESPYDRSQDSHHRDHQE